MPLRAIGFCALLDLRDQWAPRDANADVERFNLFNRDGDPWHEGDIEKALDFIVERVRTGKVLVVCIAGMSRSASMATGYLVRCGFDAVEALELVRRARPEIAPVTNMVDCVLRVARCKREKD